jgi:hypothetical protein
MTAESTDKGITESFFSKRHGVSFTVAGKVIGNVDKDSCRKPSM